MIPTRTPSSTTDPPLLNDSQPSFKLLIWMALVPLTLLLGLTLACYVWPLDNWATDLFFMEQGNRFPYRWTPLAEWVYYHGPKPGVAFGCLCMAIFFASFVWSSLRWMRMGSLFCVLAILLGPALIINGIMKPAFGRTRPTDTAIFGGTGTYVPPWTISDDEAGRSFPSGHASMGYVFMLPAFMLLARHRRLAAVVFVVGIGLGIAVGLSRMAEGRHYLSDIAWSFGIVYFTGLSLYAGLVYWRRKQLAKAGITEDTVADVLPYKGQTSPSKSREAA